MASEAGAVYFVFLSVVETYACALLCTNTSTDRSHEVLLC